MAARCRTVSRALTGRPPPLAGTRAASALARLQSIRPAPPCAGAPGAAGPAGGASRSISLPQPISCGRYSHWIPVFSTNTIPVRAPARGPASQVLRPLGRHQGRHHRPQRLAHQRLGHTLGRARSGPSLLGALSPITDLDSYRGTSAAPGTRGSPRFRGAQRTSPLDRLTALCGRVVPLLTRGRHSQWPSPCAGGA
jgi:hypothetical protein